MSNFSHFVEAEHLLNILVKRGRANSVQILANFNFFLGHTVELLIMQVHVHSIVDVGPLGRVIDLMTIVSVSLHEVIGLDKIIKKELLLLHFLLGSRRSLNCSMSAKIERPLPRACL